MLDSIAALETTASTAAAAATAVRGVAQAVAQEGVAAAHEPAQRGTAQHSVQWQNDVSAAAVAAVAMKCDCLQTGKEVGNVTCALTLR